MPLAVPPPPVSARPSGGAVIPIRLTGSLTVIPEMPEALSGTATNAGACCDPGQPQAASGIIGAEAINRLPYDEPLV